MRWPTLIALVAAAVPIVVIAEDSAPKLYTEVPEIANGESLLWHDPGPIEQLDFVNGIGGASIAPAAPFTFEKEDMSGTSAKVRVKDGNRREWVIKFGKEARPDTFATRLVWAVGYWAEPNYYVPDGVIAGAHNLGRARSYVDDRGHFRGGRFQLRSDDPKYIEGVNWNWDKNPFVGTPQLNGLKIMMMLVSNWDDKDYRDAASRGGNTAIYEQGGRYIFFIDDWGASFGNWGKLLTRSKWNSRDYFDESPNFIKSLDLGIDWGYTGQHTGLMRGGVRPSDVRWLVQYLGRITDDQLRAGLVASGASPEDVHNCMDGLRMRIGQLRTVANYPDAQAAK